MARKANTPAAANNFLRMVRILMRFAIDEGWRKDDPTFGIKALKIKSEGFHCWVDEKLETFERHWPIGTMQRLAFALLIYSFQRRGNIVSLVGSIWGKGASLLFSTRPARGSPSLCIQICRVS